MNPVRRIDRALANSVATKRMLDADPVLIGVKPALEALPGMTENTILTSGAPLPWEAYSGGQRRGVLGAAIYEGLADSESAADKKIRNGNIILGPCHDYSCVGSITGITTASMPVLVVRDQESGSTGHCVVYEGSSRDRLTYGVWNDQVRRQLVLIRDVIAPALHDAITRTGGIPLRPIIRRALGMGDDLHSRNTAATLVLYQSLSESVLASGAIDSGSRQMLRFVAESELFFLHVGMAAAKATADAASGVEGSSIVTAMAVSEREFAVRVSGLGDSWFRGPLPPLNAKLFDGYVESDMAFMGGESMIMETIGLGGMSAAAAFSLQDYSGGTPARMVNTTESMYAITEAEHPVYRIPFLSFRGTPCGIELDRILSTGITPAIHMGAAHRQGGHIGAGLLVPGIEPFQAAAAALQALNPPA